MNLQLNINNIIEKDNFQSINKLQNSICDLYTKEQQEYIFENFDNFYNDIIEHIIDILNVYTK